MRSGSMVVREIRVKDSDQVPLVQHDDMIKTIATYRSDQPFRVWILPGRSRRNHGFFDAHVFDALPEQVTVDRIAIANQKPWCIVVGKCFDDLLSYPLGSRMSRDVEMDNHATLMAKHNEAEQDAKRGGGNGKKPTATMSRT